MTTNSDDGNMETCVFKRNDHRNNNMTVSFVITDDSETSSQRLVTYVKDHMKGSLEDKVNSLVNKFGFDRETAVYLVIKTL